jgi:hypothetical protein
VRAAAVALAALAVAGCESTQARSARLARSPGRAAHEQGVKVTTRNPAVRVVATSLVHDRFGTAAVIELRSRAKQPQAALPLTFVVQGAGGRREFANDGPGLEDALTHVPLLRPGERAFWVHDQVQAAAPRRVVARVGTSTAAVPSRLPRLVAAGVRLDHDSSGAFTRGTLRNDSAVAQRKVVVYAVAERGGKVVAAGRAGIERIAGHKAQPFKVFWIGDPAGAQVRVFAPPTVLKEDGS